MNYNDYDIDWEAPKVFPHDLRVGDIVLSMAGVVEVTSDPVYFSGDSAAVQTIIRDASVPAFLPNGMTYVIQRNRVGSPDLRLVTPKPKGEVAPPSPIEVAKGHIDETVREWEASDSQEDFEIFKTRTSREVIMSEVLVRGINAGIEAAGLSGNAEALHDLIAYSASLSEWADYAAIAFEYGIQHPELAS